MSKSIKIIFLAAGGFVALLIFIAVALVVFVDANACKSHLEAPTSAAMGMEVRIDGRLGIGFFPGLLLTLRDVHILNGGADIVTAREATIGVGLIPEQGSRSGIAAWLCSGCILHAGRARAY